MHSPALFRSILFVLAGLLVVCAIALWVIARSSAFPPRKRMQAAAFLKLLIAGYLLFGLSALWVFWELTFAKKSYEGPAPIFGFLVMLPFAVVNLVIGVALLLASPRMSPRAGETWPVTPDEMTTGSLVAVYALRTSLALIALLILGSYVWSVWAR